jgi:DNA polymerase-3 subunit epsilon
MAKNFWRVGVKYIDLKLFEMGYPYVWGDGVTEWGYLEYLKEVQVGDVIVAGGIEKVCFVGEVTAKPVFLFSSDSALFDDYGIAKADNTKITDAFLPHESDITDAVCIPVKWFALDCAPLRMPTQARGGIKPLDAAGIAYVSSIISGKTNETVASFPQGNGLLDFTAIDFETGSGYRNSVCSVGLVKVVNGIIVESYSSLIKPPNNFIRDDFTDIHGITPDDIKHAPTFFESYPHWKRFVENQTLVAHNMQFDYSCLTTCLKDFCNKDMSFKTFCTMKIWRGAFENAQLSTCCEKTSIELVNHHNALADAEACARLFILAVNTGRELNV